MTLLADIAGFIAPAATVIAALMTAANLGARVTGYGFLLFCLGSVTWSIVGITTEQLNLVATNIFLTLVNMMGVWRWLGRQKAIEDGAAAAAESSRKAKVPTLFTATGFSGRLVYDHRGQVVGKTVEAMIECCSGQISYIVIASGGTGGVDEKLRSVPMSVVSSCGKGLMLLESCAEFERRDVLSTKDWPKVGPVSPRPNSCQSDLNIQQPDQTQPNGQEKQR